MAGKRKAKPRDRDRARRACGFAESSELNDRRAVFVGNYLETMNAAAARRAGYSPRSAYQTGSLLLRNAKIRAAIDHGMAEKAMGADEVLARMSERARADITPFVNDKGRLDLVAARKAGLLRHVKRITETRKGVTVQLYDAHAALVKLGELHRLWGARTVKLAQDGDPLRDVVPIDLTQSDEDELHLMRGIAERMRSVA